MILFLITVCLLVMGLITDNIVWPLIALGLLVFYTILAIWTKS